MRRLMMAGVLAAIITFLFASVTMAADANMPKAPKAEQVMVKGKVSVTKDTAGKITAVEITTKHKGKYDIVLNEKGKEIGEKMASKMVEASGTVETKNNAKWLTVEKYSEMAKPSKKPSPGQEKM